MTKQTVYVVRYDHGDYGQGIEGVYTNAADAYAAALEDIKAQDYPADYEVETHYHSDVSVFQVGDDYWYVEPAKLVE